MTHAQEIKEMISKGSIKNVVIYGEGDKPAIPYVAIIETPIPPSCQGFQIWAHVQKGKEQELERYIKEELPILMSAKKNMCNQNKYKPSSSSYDGAVWDSVDSTFKAGRQYYYPLVGL